MAVIRNVAYALLLVLVFCVLDTEAGYRCSERKFFATIYFYCAYGCCGTYTDRYCCAKSVTVGGSLGAAIAGGVIAGIVVIAIIIALIVICVKKQGRPGRVVNPMPTTNVANVNGATASVSMKYNSAGAYPYTTAPPQPMPGQPPAYNYVDPAYPAGAGQPAAFP